MKLRDTVILVVLAHVGLVLVWICMGGCANNKTQETKEKVAAVTTEEGAKEPLIKEKISKGPAAPITVEPLGPPMEEVTLPPAVGPAPAAGAKEKAVEPSPEEIKHVVKKGDTLWALSRKYKVPVAAIVDRNDIQDAALIREGRELIIPVGAAAVDKPEPKDEAPAPEGAAALPGGTEAFPVAEDAETGVYKVQPGDTVWNLARRYKTTSTAIMEANNISEPTRLKVGQELRIPKGE